MEANKRKLTKYIEQIPNLKSKSLFGEPNLLLFLLRDLGSWARYSTYLRTTSLINKMGMLISQGDGYV